MSILTEEDQMQIPKHKRIENYWPLAIYLQAALESWNVWNIVVTTKVTPNQPDMSADKELKDEYTFHSQNHAST